MRLKTINYTLKSLSIGIDIGLLIGLVYLSAWVEPSVIRDSFALILVLGVFLLGLGMSLFILAQEIEIHSDAEEVNQW